jgi:colicin import membrane protein
VIRDRYNIVPLFMAVLLHVLIAASMLFAFDFTTRKPPPMPLVIKGTLVADSAVLPPPAKEPEPEPIVEQEPPPEIDTAAEEQARLAAEEAKRQQDALIEQQRLEELRRQQEAEEQRKREEVERRKREEEAERERKRREEEAELERKRQEAELERQREIERQRAENERRRREEEAAALQSALNEEAARLEAMNSTEMAAYQFALQQKVLRNWARPASAQPGLDCVVQVRQSASGEVISARVVSCNGDAAVERSIEAAVYKASPLPLPENQLLFDPNLRFRFIPEQ